MKDPDFYGPKQNASRSDLRGPGGLTHRGELKEAGLHRLQDSSVHPQYAAWAKMMTPPDIDEPMTSAA